MASSRDAEANIGATRMAVLTRRWRRRQAARDELRRALGGGVQRFAAEIKVRRDKDGDPEDEGLEQLSEYLDRLGLDRGTLVLFDQRSDAPPIAERCSRNERVVGGRRITVLRL